MVEEPYGGYLGPVDWSYDFFKDQSIPSEWAVRAKGMLRRLDEGLKNGEKWIMTTDGGWPRVGWKPVMRVGMYDGWPYWRPVPSVLYIGTLGLEWDSWNSISGIEKVEKRP